MQLFNLNGNGHLRLGRVPEGFPFFNRMSDNVHCRQTLSLPITNVSFA